MNTIIIASSISFVVGWVASYLFNRYVKIDISLRTKDELQTKNIVKQHKKQLPPEIQNIAMLLNEVRRNGKLPFTVKPQILDSLKLIAKTPHWEKRLDQNTIENLNKIYNKWQRHLNSKGQTVQKIGNGVGFEKPKYWEGTQEEYDRAVANGEIDKNTNAWIITRDGSYISLDENGEISENMD